MSTVLIVVIVVVVMAVLFGILARLAARRRERGAERVLARRRERAVTEHRQSAESRAGRAEEAEHHARLASAVAERERAEARVHEERARAHELGLDDDQLTQEEPARASAQSAPRERDKDR